MLGCSLVLLRLLVCSLDISLLRLSGPRPPAPEGWEREHIPPHRHPHLYLGVVLIRDKDLVLHYLLLLSTPVSSSPFLLLVLDSSLE